MTRITPRTCLYPLTAALLITFGLSLGLTFRSNHHCYAGTCGETLFPLQARLHVVVWYCWLAISVTFLAVPAFHPKLRHFLSKNLFYQGKLPIIKKHLKVGGALAVLWIMTLYGIAIGIWWIRVRNYFVDKSRQGGVHNGGNKLAAVALTGHLCDITMGMVLLPISRHSALASFFKLSVSATLAFHLFTAYTLFTLVTIHGLLYLSWVPVFNAMKESLRMVLPVLNPTYPYNETWPGSTSALGVWRASLIFTGSLTALIMLALLLTTLPAVRLRHFNVFYFTHLLSILAVIVICLHASTMFYCLAPGLAMWLLDWGMRLYELRETLDGKISTVGKGWYCLELNLPRRRLDGCACTSPLAHFYIHHSDSSLRELHPFTTITHLATQKVITNDRREDIAIQFLFRKRGASAPPLPNVPTRTTFWSRQLARMRRERRENMQWTDRLASLVDQEQHARNRKASEAGTMCRNRSDDISLADVPTTGSGTATTFGDDLNAMPFGDDHTFPVVNCPLRLEGPYFTPADPASYEVVICMVAGTGVSGAIAIASAFAQHEAIRAEQIEAPNEAEAKKLALEDMSRSKSTIWKRCVIVWTTRTADYVDLPFFKANPASSLEIKVHLTGKGLPRLDMTEAIGSITRESPQSRTWVYLSGPNRFIESGLEACKAAGVDSFAARWDI